MAPAILTRTLGVVAPELRHYIAYLKAVRFYVGLAGWALGAPTLLIRAIAPSLTPRVRVRIAIWISFLPLINGRAVPGADGTVKSQSTLSLITQGLFGIFLNLVILLVEKLIVQIMCVLSRLARPS